MPSYKPARPHDLPDFHLELLGDSSFWNAHVQMEKLRPELAIWNGHPERVVKFREDLRSAVLWWVGDDAVELLEEARKTIPPCTLTEELIPAPSGFVCFEHPLSGIDALNGVKMDIDYLVWKKAQVGDVAAGDRRPNAISIIAGKQIDDVVALLGRADWMIGTDFGDVHWESEQHRIDSIAEDQSTIATLWLLAGQSKLVANEPVHPGRAIMRRAKRHRAEHLGSVRYIHLPRAIHGGGIEADETASRHYRHRWIVSGHWRQQAYGPQRSLRKPLWIAPHIKGPSGKPLITTPKVHIWAPTKGE